MQVEQVPIASLQQDEHNARMHSKKNLEAIKTSLATFGQQKPIVVGMDDTIIAGNGTYQAASELGWSEIAIIRTDLDGHQRTAFAIADNKTTDLSEWHYEELSQLLHELGEVDDELLAATGFSEDELKPLLQAEWKPPEMHDLETHQRGESSAKTDSLSGHTVQFTPQQWETVVAAIRRCREINDDQSISNERCIEMLSAEYIS